MSKLELYRRIASGLISLVVLSLLGELFGLTAFWQSLPLQAAPGYRYFDYSREEWGADPRFDSRNELHYPVNARSFQATSPDQDSGQVYHPQIQPGQLISLPDPMQTPTGIAIHDTATPNSADCSLAATSQVLRSIQRYHALEDFAHIPWGPEQPDPRGEINNRGLTDASFGDIGYHFLIDCAGHVYEGRAGGIFRQGRHVHRHNRGQIGIALIGSFEDRQPSPTQRAALVRLVSRLCRDLGIDPLGEWQQLRLDGSLEKLTKNGKPVMNIAGHRDFPDNDHVDPGVVDLSQLRQEVAGRIAGGDNLKFEETGQTLAEPFRAYWEANGGLPIFGLPLSPLRSEVSAEDGKTYQVQYFERARFELHPELVGTPYYILLGRLGERVAARIGQRYPEPFQRKPPPAPGEGEGEAGQKTDSHYFAETGHFLKTNFLEYWKAKGGLEIFGLPLSEEFEEVNEQGQSYRVQYFERARFEFHPEAPPGYTVLLGLLGIEAYQAVGGSNQGG
jgi:hypothetical protein